MTIAELLAYCGAHESVFVDNAPGIGLTAGQATSFATATATAKAAYDAHQAKMQEARAAGVEARAALAALRTNLSSVLSIIRGYANTQPSPAAVYALAQVTPPAPPSPAPAPSQPTDFRAELIAGGAVKITWKAPNPSGAAGTLWFINRKLSGESTFTQVGVSGSRSFVDTTIPASSGGGMYIIHGQRGNSVGEQSLPFVIELGVSGPGVTITNQFTGDLEAAA